MASRPGESWNYVNSTCVEITPCGSSNVWVASPYYSLPQILLDEIQAQANPDLRRQILRRIS